MTKENEIKELKEALKKMIPSQNKLQKDLKEEREKHEKTKEQLKVGLWEELETYFLVRGLTEDKIEEVYKEKEINFNEKSITSISNNSKKEEIEISRKVFQSVINIIAADKFLEVVTDMENYEKNNLIITDDYLLTSLQMVEKGLIDSLSEEIKSHKFYLKDIENGQLQRVKETIKKIEEQKIQVRLESQQVIPS
jgi:hypothetical protein